MKYIIKDILHSKDIVPNIVETYPTQINKALSEEDFYSLLKCDNHNIICYHITRLTDNEIESVKKQGLIFGGKSLLLEKVKNLPICCNWFKGELIEYINDLAETQSDNAICASYGLLDLENDPACDNIFKQNWGGESIYNYYDTGDGFQDNHMRTIHETLQKISYPCLVLLRIDIDTFINSQFGCLYEKFKAKKTEIISGSLYIQNALPEVVDIIDLSVYDGLSFD